MCLFVGEFVCRVLVLQSARLCGPLSVSPCVTFVANERQLGRVVKAID
jgi:hypothetical protein